MKVKEVITELKKLPQDYELEFHEGNTYEMCSKIYIPKLLRLFK